MPRNGAGVYSLPQPAFVSGTKIASAAVNSDFSDIAAALTQSFSADGQTPFTGIFKNASGNSSNPSYTFTSDLTTGVYLAGVGDLGIAAGGIQVATFQSGGITWSAPVTIGGNLTINSTSITFGAGAASAWWTGLSSTIVVEIIIDGGGSVIASGQHGQVRIPCSISVGSWHVMADQSGSITVDILKAHQAVPSSSMTTGGTAPNLSSSQLTAGTTTGWASTSLVADDWIAFNVTGTPSSVTRVTVSLEGTRTSS